jgi:hypothetical protein
MGKENTETIAVQPGDIGFLLKTTQTETQEEVFQTLEQAREKKSSELDREHVKDVAIQLTGGTIFAGGLSAIGAGVYLKDAKVVVIGVQLCVIGASFCAFGDKRSSPENSKIDLVRRQLKQINSALEESEKPQEAKSGE